jgi:AcrR family transcriptional regulator
MDTTAGTTVRERVRGYSPTQRRTITAALDLFADHGVGGTSLQMIADAVGVTKAAVYHQFQTKEAIVRAVLEVGLQPLEEALEEAESEGRTLKAREALLARVIDASVARRRAVSALQNDPVMVRLLGEHEPSQQLWPRLFAVLLGDKLGDQARVRAAVLSAAIGAVGHPFIEHLDDQTVAAELLQVTRRLIFRPG